jgi:hypothetical protein
VRTVTICIVGAVLIALGVWFRPEKADDFIPFYRAASLASPRGNVYADPSWSPKEDREDRFLPYLRIPAYAGMLRPFTAVPYAPARIVWIACLILAVVAGVWLFPSGRGPLAIALCFSFPLADSLIVGQDAPLVLLIVLASAAIFSTGREFLAGVAASLLCIKITWLPPAGLVFLTRSRRGFLGILTGTALQITASFAIGGARWPADYLAILRDPRLDPEPGRMLSVRAMAFSLSLPNAVYIAAGIILYAAFWWLCRRVSVADALTVALALGLIAAPHCKVYDGVVLIPLFVRVATRKRFTGWLAWFALTPVLYLMVLMGPPALQLAGSSLIVATTVAAAWRIYRGANTTATSSS